MNIYFSSHAKAQEKKQNWTRNRTGKGTKNRTKQNNASYWNTIHM